MQLTLPISFSDGINLQAVMHNHYEKNTYGSVKFKVIHSGGYVMEYYAQNKSHLLRLLRIEMNLGYITCIDKIINLKS